MPSAHQRVASPSLAALPVAAHARCALPVEPSQTAASSTYVANRMTVSSMSNISPQHEKADKHVNYKGSVGSSRLLVRPKPKSSSACSCSQTRRVGSMCDEDRHIAAGAVLLLAPVSSALPPSLHGQRTVHVQPLHTHRRRAPIVSPTQPAAPQNLAAAQNPQSADWTPRVWFERVNETKRTGKVTFGPQSFSRQQTTSMTRLKSRTFHVDQRRRSTANALTVDVP